jgi:hypothetical protein
MLRAGADDAQIVEVHVERHELTEAEPADDHYTERPSRRRPRPEAKRQRQRSNDRGDGGHHDRPVAYQARLDDRLDYAADGSFSLRRCSGCRVV